MLRAIVILVLVLPLWSGQSIVLPASTSVSFTDPSYAVDADWTAEIHIDSWTLPTSPTDATLIQWQGVGARALMSHSDNLYLYDARNTYSAPGYCSMSIAGRTNIVVRWVRDATAGTLTCELWNSDGTGYDYKVLTRTAAGSTSSGGTLGSSSANMNNVSLGFARVKHAATARGSQQPLTADTGFDRDWKFDGNGTAAAGGNNITTTSFSFAATNGQVVYAVGSSEYKQAWQPYAPLRAGQATELQSDSFTMADSGTVTCFWQQIDFADEPRPSTVYFDDRTSCTPSITGTVFGSYRFRLVVSDGTSTDSTDFDAAAVAWSDNGAIVYPNDTLAKILGPAVPPHANPWEWFEVVRNETYQRLIGDKYPTNGGPYYFEPEEASIGGVARAGTITGDSVGYVDVDLVRRSTITGSGTNFGAALCGGSAPCTPSGKQFMLWAPLDSGAGGYWYARTIHSVESDTSATIDGTCSPENSTCASAMTWGTLGYSGGGNGGWNSTSGSGSNINFYDAVLGLYGYYYQTGWYKYRNDARWLADRWCVYQWSRVQVRDGAMVGCYIRASIDTDDPPAYSILPSIRDGLTNWFTTRWSDASIGFTREDAYFTAYTAVQALLDPDATVRATAQTRLDTALDNTWSDAGNRNSDDSWGEGTLPTAALDSARVVTVTNGSATVTRYSGTAFPSTYCDTIVYDTGTVSIAADNVTLTISGGSFIAGHDEQIIFLLGTLSGQPYSMMSEIASVDSSSQVTLRHPWRGDSGSTITAWRIVPEAPDGVTLPLEALGFREVDSSGTAADPPVQDNAWYWCTYVSADEITLNTPYTGDTSGGNIYRRITPKTAGKVTQPYVQGILGWAFDLAALAKDADADTTRAATLRGLRDELADYLLWAQDSDTKGLPYYTSMSICPPYGQKSYACNSKGTDQRDYMAETNGMMAQTCLSGYLSSATCDTWYKWQWARTGYSAPEAGDGSYTQGPENTFISDKAWGQSWGQGQGHRWPGARVGGPAADVSRTVTFNFSLASVPNADHVTVSCTQANGAAVSGSSSSGSGNVNLSVGALQAGGATCTYSYRSAADAVLASATLPLLVD